MLSCVGYAHAVILLDYSDPDTQQGDGGFEGIDHWTFGGNNGGGLIVNGGGANPDAWQGTKIAYIWKDLGAGNYGYSFTTAWIPYTSGMEITFSGYYNITGGDFSAGNYTALKIEYDDATIHEGAHYSNGTADWTLGSMQSTNGSESATQVRFTISITGDGDALNSVYWDGLTASAVPEPSSIAFFGMGLLGLIGAGWRRFRAAKQ
jgi:hypothetical protein